MNGVELHGGADSFHLLVLTAYNFVVLRVTIQENKKINKYSGSPIMVQDYTDNHNNNVFEIVKKYQYEDVSTIRVGGVSSGGVNHTDRTLRIMFDTKHYDPTAESTITYKNSSKLAATYLSVKIGKDEDMKHLVSLLLGRSLYISSCTSLMTDA